MVSRQGTRTIHALGNAKPHTQGCNTHKISAAAVGWLHGKYEV